MQSSTVLGMRGGGGDSASNTLFVVVPSFCYCHPLYVLGGEVTQRVMCVSRQLQLGSREQEVIQEGVDEGGVFIDIDAFTR